MKRSGRLLVNLLSLFLIIGSALLTVSCGSEDDMTGGGGGTLVGGGDNSLIGVWELSTVNGQDIAPGVWLRWEITATTITVTSDWDCVEVIRYDASNGQLVGTEIISQTGTQCDLSGENPVVGPYTVTQDTLTIYFEDPDVTPPEATIVFVRVG